jgi:YD repeat-containing protein
MADFRLSYDASGRLLSAWKWKLDKPEERRRDVREEEWESLQYDSAGRLSESHGGVQYRHRIAPQRKLLHVRRFYDSQGRLERVEYRTEDYQWYSTETPPWRLLQTSMDVDTFVHDAAGFLVKKVSTRLSPAQSMDFVYADGKLVEAHSATGTRAYLTQDGEGRITGEKVLVCRGKCEPGSESRYTYDEAGRLVEALRDDFDDYSGGRFRSTWKYSPEGRLLLHTLQTNVGSKVEDAFTTEFERDAQGRLSRLRYNGQTIETYSYQGECANLRLPSERNLMPDVPGWHQTRACATGYLTYGSDCVWRRNL